MFMYRFANGIQISQLTDDWYNWIYNKLGMTMTCRLNVESDGYGITIKVMTDEYRALYCFYVTSILGLSVEVA